ALPAPLTPFFHFDLSRHHPDLHSFPTRRSSDLMNAIHGLYSISNDDYLYVLSTFIFDPALFVARFGFRGLTPKEQDAFFYMYRRSEEHTSELQSRFDLVCRLLLEKKNYDVGIHL